jgi:hypothetical protein
LCCGGGGWLVFRDPQTPEQVVHRYFEALADRDADEARSFLVRAWDEDVETVLLDDDTVEHKDYTPPRNMEIEQLTPEESRLAATMQVSYTIAGASYERELRLIRDHQHQSWRILRGWLLLPANTRTAYPLIIAGTVVPKSDTTTVPAFPGVYVVRLAKQSLFEAPAVTAIAGAAHAPGLQLRLRGARQGELERQVREHLDRCAGSSDPDPSGCPFDRASEVEYPQTVLRRITQYPPVQLVIDGDALTVMSETPGRAEVTAGISTGPPRLVAQESFTVLGRLIIDGDSFTFAAE